MKKRLNDFPNSISGILQTIIIIGLVMGLVAWCISILAPFLNLIIWGIVLAVAAYPSYNKLTTLLGNRKNLAAVIITLLFLAIMIVPGIILTESLVHKLRDLAEGFEPGSVKIAPPPAKVADWPIIGKSIYQMWSTASTSLESLILKYEPQLIRASKWMLTSIVETGLGLIKFMASIIISGIILAHSKAAGKMVVKIFERIAGEKGKEYILLIDRTIQNVTRGILGVAILQALLTGLGLILAGIPGAGLWTFLALIFAIVQLGVAPVTIPAIIYIFYAMDPLPAILLTVYFILIMLSDNILKPLLLGRGAPVPMLVVFLGAIGGFITSGFLGLFTGAVILSVGYKLFLVWIEGDENMPIEVVTEK